MPATYPGRQGGAGPAEGQVILIRDRYLNVPTSSPYVKKSPYRIDAEGEKMLLKRDEVNVCEVSVPGRPSYYSGCTKNGIPFEKIALLHGCDCFASTIYQNCAYRQTDQQCKFCGIGMSLENSKTILKKEPEDLAAAAAHACRTDGVKHVTLTAGRTEDEYEVLSHAMQCIAAIKKDTGLPVHMQLCPTDRPGIYEELRRAGADTLGIHIETFDEQVLASVVPAKAAIGLDRYRENWLKAVEVFGPNQVSSFLIAGLGETQESLLEGAEYLCSIGVYPYVLPVRPIPGTALEALEPPPPEMMIDIYEQVAGMLARHGLSYRKSKAGCVRCSSCSCLNLFEDYANRTAKE